jgi:hypothetical protein
MNNKFYFKYYLLLLITLNTINVYSFNPRSNQFINFLVIRNVNTCPYSPKLATAIVYCKISTNSYLDSLNKTNNLQNMTLSNNTIKKNIKLNTLFFNKLLFYINNYTYS